MFARVAEMVAAARLVVKREVTLTTFMFDVPWAKTLSELRYGIVSVSKKNDVFVEFDVNAPFTSNVLLTVTFDANSELTLRVVIFAKVARTFDAVKRVTNSEATLSVVTLAKVANTLVVVRALALYTFPAFKRVTNSEATLSVVTFARDAKTLVVVRALAL